MKTKPIILIFAEGVSMAHPTRMWELAKKINPETYEIHFATSKNYFPYLEGQDHIFKHENPTISTSTFNTRLFETEFPYTADELIQFFKNDERLIKQISPNFIISDFRVTAYSVAQKLKIPYFNIIQYHWHPEFKKEVLIPYNKNMLLFGRNLNQFFFPIFKTAILRKQLQVVNTFQKHIGFPNFNSIFEFYSAGDFLLFPDLPSLFPNAQLKNNEFFIGPLFWKNTNTTWNSQWPKEKSPLKTIYVSMGSTGNHEIGNKIVNALALTGYQLFVATSGKSYTINNANPNIYLDNFISADTAMNMADLVICNGGTSTTYHALSKGIPIFAFPTNMDQYLHMNQLKKMGVANYTHIDTFEEQSFNRSIDLLLSNNKLSTKMAQLKNEIAHFSEINFLCETLKSKWCNPNTCHSEALSSNFRNI